MNRVSIICPQCGREGKLPEGVSSVPKRVKCPGCQIHFEPGAIQVDEFSVVPAVATPLGDFVKQAAGKVKEAASTAKDFVTSDDARLKLARARQKLQDFGDLTRGKPSTLNRGEEGPSGTPGFAGAILDVLDLKFHRYYTILLVNLLWAGYLILAALLLLLCVLWAVVPAATAGLVSDLAATFYDPRRGVSGSAGGAQGGLVPLIVAVFMVGFFGMNLRVFLELLSVQFRIADTLKEFRQPQVSPSDVSIEEGGDRR